MYRPTSCLIFILLVELCSAYFYSTEPFQQQVEQPYGGAYQFSYQTGSQGQPDLAQSFREESRDEYGNVVGKYGYVDPYGQLRVVKYRAGADGYYAEGDTGVDQEALRQQKLLYANDEATQIQQQTWQQPLGGSSSSSAAASAASSASSSSSSQSYESGQQNFGGGSSSRQDWTTVNDNSINQQYNSVKGGQQKVVERLIAAPVKSPITSLKYRTNQYTQQVTSNQYDLPVVRQYSHTTYHTVPGSIQYVQPTYNKYASQTKSIQSKQYSGALKNPSSRFKEVQQTPVFKPLTSYPSSSHQSSAASSSVASAAASASSSSSSFGGGPSFGFGETKGDGGLASYRLARYSVPGSGKAHAKVNFKQFGPSPFQYSYSF